MNKLSKILLLLYLCIFRRKYYDLTMYHYLHLYLVKYIRFFSIFSRRTAAIPWGSDIFQLEKKDEDMLRMILDSVDYINCSTLEMKDKIKSILKHNNAFYFSCRFGLPVLEDINTLINKNASTKQLFNILEIEPGEYNHIITVGYNASPNQQHLTIIESLSKYTWEKCLFIFPLTYPLNIEYNEKILSLLETTSLNYIIFKDYLSNQQVASLRLLSDYFIQLQETDALSASTQEHLYAGSIVITGDWLPYSTLKKAGAIFLTISDPKDIGRFLKNEILKARDLSIRKVNREIISNLSRWDLVINDWINMINHN